MHLPPTTHTPQLPAEAGTPMANLVPGRIEILRDVLRNLGFAGMTRLLGRNAASVNHYYILYVTLSDLPLTPPKCLGGSALQLLRPEEMGQLYTSLPSLAIDDRRELLSRLLFYKSGFRNCYAMKAGDAIAYLQWLVLPSENSVITKDYGRKFLPLNPKEVMIENSFTFPDYRGRGFLSFGTWQLLNTAKELGYKRAVAYIRKDRIDPLNCFLRLGFMIKRIVREYKVLGYGWRSL